MTENALAKLDTATRMLAEVRTVDEAKDIIDLAEAARVYAKQVGLGLEAQNHAAEIKVRAQWKAGEILDAMEKAKGGEQYHRLDPLTSAPVLPTYSELGFNKYNAHVWHTIHILAADVLDTMMTVTKMAGREISTSEIYKTLRREINKKERLAKLANINANNKPLNEGIGKFNVLLADPPWQYEHPISDSRMIENQYPTRPIEWILEQPVQTICEDDAILFLWASTPMLRKGMQVLDTWGFDYRTSMVWVKPSIGPGQWVRQRHECLLIGVKGNIPTPRGEDKPDSVIEAPRQKHSQKPEIIYSIIEKMYPTLSKVELFARNRREGWAAWGNQV